MQQVEELTKELGDYKLAQENVMYNLDKNKNEISDLMHDLQMAQKKILTIEAQKSAYEEINLGRAIDSILKAKIKGVHAPLLQLGSVEKEYSTALEVAMGGRMKNIVVDSTLVLESRLPVGSSAKRMGALPPDLNHSLYHP